MSFFLRDGIMDPACGSDLGWSKLIDGQQWSRVTRLSSIAFIALYVTPTMAVMPFDYPCASDTPRKLKSGVYQFAHFDDSEMQVGTGSEGNKNPILSSSRLQEAQSMLNAWDRPINVRTFFLLILAFIWNSCCSATAKLMESRFLLKAFLLYNIRIQLKNQKSIWCNK